MKSGFGELLKWILVIYTDVSASGHHQDNIITTERTIADAGIPN